MLYKYTAIDNAGEEKTGTIESANEETVIMNLQHRGLVVASVEPASKTAMFSSLRLPGWVTNKDKVIFSRQIAVLFESRISAIRIFRLLGTESKKAAVQDTFLSVANDIEAGMTISQSLAKHPQMFSELYVNIVQAGEDSGKLSESFNSLADYLDRTYELVSKAKYALVYPIFVLCIFVGVMVFLLVNVIPNLTAIILETGQEVPVYTKVVIALSNFFVNYGVFLAIGLVVASGVLWRISRTEEGRIVLDRYKLSIPYIGHLYSMLYLSRIADNMFAMLTAGIPMLKSIHSTGDVAGNRVFRAIMYEVEESVRGGALVSEAMARYSDIPRIMTAMVKVGEETGEMGKILGTMATFYRREVFNAVDALINLIQPALIVVLAAGVGIVLASVLVPIYNITESI